MDLFNPLNILYPDMTMERAREMLEQYAMIGAQVPYIIAKQLFVIAEWDMTGAWIPHSYIGLTIEESIRRAQLRNVVYDQDLIYIVTPSDDSILLTNILAEKTQNMKIITETGEKPGEI